LSPDVKSFVKLDEAAVTGVEVVPVVDVLHPPDEPERHLEADVSLESVLETFFLYLSRSQNLGKYTNNRINYASINATISVTSVKILGNTPIVASIMPELMPLSVRLSQNLRNRQN